MIDGIFAVAITLSPAALADGLHRGSSADHLLSVTAVVLFIALTMMLLWLKLRTIVQMQDRLTTRDVIGVTVILMVAVLIPQSGYLALKTGHLEGNLWNWSDSQWANVEYQALLLLVETALLILSWRMMDSPKAKVYPKSVRRWMLNVELFGILCLLILVILDNVITGINGIYVYAIPVLLLAEEGLCLLRMKVFARARKEAQGQVEPGGRPHGA